MSRTALLMFAVVACGGASPSTPASDAKPAAECTTACDCKPGYACNAGTCMSGTIAVFCCDACPAGAPAAQSCQRKDGSFASCGTH